MKLQQLNSSYKSAGALTVLFSEPAVNLLQQELVAGVQNYLAALLGPHDGARGRLDLAFEYRLRLTRDTKSIGR